ncbi:scm-like with four MBT domains protein 2 isoform X1 [Macrobrachium rosenbergii]|uniref:scm-like with four MBT domains protein 2 isoform X1 n=2 Tax=Macrobrachium rosenbergii TaxID=79674 RepID=UPI0034D4ACE6
MDNEQSQAVQPVEADEETDSSANKATEISEKPPSDEEFEWEEYLEETQTEAVPPSAFYHVEKSLESGMEVGQILEVIHHNEENVPVGYWIAKIVTICGPLLRLRYVAQSSVSLEVWKEISSGNLQPVGWSSQRSIPLAPSQELFNSLKEESSVAEAKKAVEEALLTCHSVPEEALEGEGYTAIDRIKQGMKVEVLHDGDPFSGWVATVLENVGGRLQLRYDTPDCSGEVLWLFYQHYRLRPLDWIYHQGTPWRYKNPNSSTSYGEAEWAALLEMSRDDARHSQLPVSLLLPLPNPDTHHFVIGMLLEVIHPHKPHTVEVGHISRVISPQYFEVTIKPEGCEALKWITYMNDPLLLPSGFCKEHNLTLSAPNDWPKNNEFNVEDYARSTGSLFTGKDMFTVHESSEEIGFTVGNKLECVHSSYLDKICIATVTKLCGHLVVIELDSELEPVPVIRPATSQDLFPMGWCQTNGYSVQLPAKYSPKAKTSEITTSEETREKSADSPGTTDTPSSSGNQLSMWCPRLYINHCCFTGPYLSKSKVAKQSQSVGPGSVELVLREVLAMTINAAYIPTRALRELERSVNESQNIPSSWHPMVFKAKFKRYTTTANIPVATTANGVNDFLSLICQVLQCCPNLWSTKSTGENCPFLCTSQMLTQANPSSYFRGRGRIASNRGGRGGLIYRRKRGGRKRLFVPIRANRLLQPKSLATPTYDASEDIEDDDECEVEEGEEEENISGSEEGIASFREELPQKRRRTEYPDASPGLEPAAVTSDPLQWTVKDVEVYVASQPAICHHAVRLREQEVDGRAFLLLNLPTLVQNLGLPHSSAVSLAQHICRVKLAHFMYYRCDA